MSGERFQRTMYLQCGGVMDKNLGLDVSVECLNKCGNSSPVKTVVALYLLVFVGIVKLECLIALMKVLLSFFISKFI